MRWPSREPGSTCGAMLMLSCPPAMTISESPSRIACAASITAFRPEPQTLLMVIAGTPLGSPDLITDWRAGFCPAPACSTWPRITSLICSPDSLARLSSSTITAAPSSGAGVLAKAPPNLPTAVRVAATITISVMSISKKRFESKKRVQAFCFT